jgi:hypothetical protein
MEMGQCWFSESDGQGEKKVWKVDGMQQREEWMDQVVGYL